MAKEVPAKTISLTGDHVWMPEDLMRQDFATAEETKKYVAKDADGKRVKYRVYAGLADLLVSRDQAMEVPD
jgi:hypothetical protein